MCKHIDHGRECAVKLWPVQEDKDAPLHCVTIMQLILRAWQPPLDLLTLLRPVASCLVSLLLVGVSSVRFATRHKLYARTVLGDRNLSGGVDVRKVGQR
jgi:hypothetical protein